MELNMGMAPVPFPYPTPRTKVQLITPIRNAKTFGTAPKHPECSRLGEICSFSICSCFLKAGRFHRILWKDEEASNALATASLKLNDIRSSRSAAIG
jgi:hypothetical protein